MEVQRDLEGLPSWIKAKEVRQYSSEDPAPIPGLECRVSLHAHLAT